MVAIGPSNKDLSKRDVALGAGFGTAMIVITELVGRAFPKIRPIHWLVGGPLSASLFVGVSLASHAVRLRVWKDDSAQGSPSKAKTLGSFRFGSSSGAPSKGASSAGSTDSHFSSSLEYAIKLHWDSLPSDYSWTTSQEAVIAYLKDSSAPSPFPGREAELFEALTQLVVENGPSHVIEDLIDIGLARTSDFKDCLQALSLKAEDNGQHLVAMTLARKAREARAWVEPASSSSVESDEAEIASALSEEAKAFIRSHWPIRGVSGASRLTADTLISCMESKESKLLDADDALAALVKKALDEKKELELIKELLQKSNSSLFLFSIHLDSLHDYAQSLGRADVVASIRLIRGY